MVQYETNRHIKFAQLLDETAAFHGHICPGQVLGVRMSLLGCRELGITDPHEYLKRLIVYVEIDRCAADAIQVVTGCKLGKRTMKFMDYGKVAASFVDLSTGGAVRVVTREDARDKVIQYLAGRTKYEAQIISYKNLPDEELFRIENVRIEIPVEDMPGPTLRRVICSQCGEGINDCREVTLNGKLLCRACASGSYYSPMYSSKHGTPLAT